MKQESYKQPAPNGLISDPSLVLFLPLYQLDGAAIISKDAYGRLCSVSGASWRPDGRYFDGVDDEIGCGNDSSIQIGGAITAEVWGKFEGYTGDYRQVLWKRFNDAGGAQGWQMYLGSNSNTVNVLRWLDGAAIGIDSAFTPDEFIHVVFTYDGANQRLYIGGDLAVVPVADTSTVKTATALRIGANPGTGYVGGTIGEIRMYNRALTPLEIQHNYLATKWRYQ
jgi:hypothetical protein